MTEQTTNSETVGTAVSPPISPIEELIGQPLSSLDDDALREHVHALREARLVPSKMKSLLTAEAREKSRATTRRQREDKARREAASIVQSLDLGLDDDDDEEAEAAEGGSPPQEDKP